MLLQLRPQQRAVDATMVVTSTGAAKRTSLVEEVVASSRAPPLEHPWTEGAEARFDQWTQPLEVQAAERAPIHGAPGPTWGQVDLT